MDHIIFISCVVYGVMLLYSTEVTVQLQLVRTVGGFFFSKTKIAGAKTGVKEDVCT